MKPTFAILLFVMLQAWIPAHGQRMQDWMTLGDEAMADRDPYGAMLYYAKALELDSNKGVLNYKYAESLRANHRYSKAAYYYRKVYDRDYGRLFPEGGIRLAEMLKQSGRYEESKRIWRQVRDQNETRPESYEYRKAVQEMRSADLSMRWSEQAPLFDLEALPEPINDEDSEFAGWYGAEGEFVFSSMRGKYDEQGRLLTPAEEYYTRIYKVENASGSIEEVYPDMGEAHANYFVAPWGEVFLTRHIDGRSIIYAHRGGEFVQVLPRDDSDTANYTQAAPTLVDGQKVVFFASDREGGYGGLDLWKLSLEAPEARPENLGSEVNSQGNEITPFFRSDENRLYFASDWHHGFGGYDVFFAEVKEGGFRQPQNLMQPYNSSANDMYYSFNATTGQGSITSNRTIGKVEETASCCNDLWKFTESIIQETDTTPKIESLEELNAYLPVTLYFHNDEPNPRTTSDTTKLDYPETYYRYLGLLPKYEEQYSAGLMGAEADAAEETIDDFFLDEVDGGMRNLQVFTSLLLGELEEGERIDVTVRGYASPLARTDYNVHLANRRIVSLINYLKSYRSGALMPYFENRSDVGGALRVVGIPFGEYVADPLVSDNPNESDAIYGIGAARERRIQIVSVGRLGTDTTLAEVVFDREIIDLGVLAAGEAVEFSFHFEIKGGIEWSVDSVGTRTDGVGHIALDEKEKTYPPAGMGTWSGTLTAGERPGKYNALIIIRGNIPGGQRELNLTFEIRP